MSPHCSAVFLQHSRSAAVIAALGTAHAITGNAANNSRGGLEIIPHPKEKTSRRDDVRQTECACWGDEQISMDRHDPVNLLRATAHSKKAVKEKRDHISCGLLLQNAIGL